VTDQQHSRAACLEAHLLTLCADSWRARRQARCLTLARRYWPLHRPLRGVPGAATARCWPPCWAGSSTPAPQVRPFSAGCSTACTCRRNQECSVAPSPSKSFSCGLTARTAGTVGRLTAAAARAAAAATLDAVGAAASAAPLVARAAASAAWWPASRLAAASSAGAGAAAWALGVLLAGAEVEVRAWRGGASGDDQRALTLRAAAHMPRRPSARPRRAADLAQPKPASAHARPAADAPKPAVRSAPGAFARFHLLHRAYTCKRRSTQLRVCLALYARNMQSKRVVEKATQSLYASR